jgi:hypothetical protein
MSARTVRPRRHCRSVSRRVVYVGARRLIPVAEIERFLREQGVVPISATAGRSEVPANGGSRASRGPEGASDCPANTALQARNP